MAKRGGYRQKMNLDLTPEEFSKLSLREANDIIDRLAKRYNQRISVFYKKLPYEAQRIYAINEVEVGTTVFSRKKSKTINEARKRFSKLFAFGKSQYSSITHYKKVKEKEKVQLAVNLGLIDNIDSDAMSKDDINMLSGFFDYVYNQLSMNKEEYNYRELGEFFSTYKLTEKERGDRLENIKEAWRNFQKSNQDIATEIANSRKRMREAGILKRGDNRPISEIYREMMEKEKEE